MKKKLIAFVPLYLPAKTSAASLVLSSGGAHWERSVLRAGNVVP